MAAADARRDAIAKIFGVCGPDFTLRTHSHVRSGQRSSLTQYASAVILMNMKVGERGQVTIPKEIREQFGLGPDTEVEFRVVGGSIVLSKAPRKLNLEKWKGKCGGSLSRLGYSSVDEFIDDVRGR